MRAVLFSLIVVSLAASPPAIAVICVDRNAPGPSHNGQSWDTAYLTIQEAVSSAQDDREIWVADGIYSENVILTGQVQLYGGFLGAEPGGYESILGDRDWTAHISTIEGGGAGSCVVMATDARVDGFTMINGLAESTGGGIDCVGIGEGAVITHNTIRQNTAPLGGGISCIDSSPLIADNTIAGNHTTGEGGGIFCLHSSPVLTRNRVLNNTSDAWGGGINIVSSDLTITDCVVGANTAAFDGGGIFVYSDSLLTLVNMMLIDNLAHLTGGGIGTDDSIIEIINCTLGGNKGANGWGIACDSFNEIEPSTLAIVNSILYDGGSEIRNNDASTIAITFSDVLGGWPGDGNLDADPQFVDAGNGDCHLADGSPCIDAGSNLAPGLPSQDFEGDPRVVDGNRDLVDVVDMGADEFVPSTQYVTTTAPAGWFNPGWVWFSIPLLPSGSANATGVLGFDATNRLFRWDDARKSIQLYPDDFTDLELGRSYLARLVVGEAYTPTYLGTRPGHPFERLLPAAGWSWVGVPDTADLGGTGLSLRKDGVTRTAAEDRANAVPWLNWNWIFWDPVRETAGIMNPFGGGDDIALHPWFGYRVWANTENVTIVFP